MGTAVAQWLRCCATNRKVAGSILTGSDTAYKKRLYTILKELFNADNTQQTMRITRLWRMQTGNLFGEIYR